MITAFADVPTPQSHIIIGWMGGAIDRVAPGATAFGHRDARAEAWIIGCSGDEPLEPTTAWVRGLWDALAPYASGGTYVNALASEASVRDAYEAEVLDRLVAVKRRYDPDGVLDGNGIGR